MFNSQIMGPKGILKFETYMVEDHKRDSGDANQSNVNIVDYFMSSPNIEVDK